VDPIRPVYEDRKKLKLQHDYTGLCGSCRYASLAETKNGRLLIECDWFDRNIREPIVRCSKHSDLRNPGLSDMRNTAWILQTDQKKKVIGFISNQEWRKSRSLINDVLIEDDLE